MSKLAQIAYTRAIARSDDIAASGVTVHAMCPGWVATGKEAVLFVCVCVCVCVYVCGTACGVGLVIVVVPRQIANTPLPSFPCPAWSRLLGACLADMGGSSAPKTPAQGADTAIWLATSADRPANGEFYGERSVIEW